MNEGWISLHRRIKKNWVWSDPLHFKIWVDFLMRANHKPNKILFNNTLITVERGSFITSLKKLAKEYKCSIGKIRRLLKNFENDSMVVLKTTHKATQITICNYSSYQDERHTKSTQTEIKRKSDGNQTETNNNVLIMINNESITISDAAFQIWRDIFLKNPGAVEIDFVTELINTHGYTKARQIIYSLRSEGFNLIRTMKDSLNPDGSIKPKNGTVTREASTFKTCSYPECGNKSVWNRDKLSGCSQHDYDTIHFKLEELKDEV